MSVLLSCRFGRDLQPNIGRNVPILRGLSSPFGWEYVPGNCLESIQIAKGASSVINGYESVTGQINLELMKPEHSTPLTINLYGNEAAQFEGNIVAAIPVGKRVWTSLFLHGMNVTYGHDSNKDTFLDMPKTQRINAYNRWFYLNEEKDVESRTGIKLKSDKKRSYSGI